MTPAAGRLEAKVQGTVQGVGFRWFVQRRAGLLALTGGARNLRDGSVEVIAEGPPDALAALLQDLASGPSGARVSGVQHAWLKATGEYSNFEIWSSR